MKRPPPFFEAKRTKGAPITTWILGHKILTVGLLLAALVAGGLASGGKDKDASVVRTPPTVVPDDPYTVDPNPSPTYAGGVLPSVLADDSATAPPPVTTKPATIASVSFSGRGDSLTRKFQIVGGITVFRLTHTGSSNFIVQLKDASTGETVEYVTNEIGSYRGARLFAIEEGTYVLNIQADGRWTARVEQPRPTSGASLPRRYSGRGDAVVGAFSFDGGLMSLALSHAGESNFIVQVYSQDGSGSEIVVNEIGRYNGTQGVEADAGLYLIDVQADGAWSITIS